MPADIRCERKLDFIHFCSQENIILNLMRNLIEDRSRRTFIRSTAAAGSLLMLNKIQGFNQAYSRPQNDQTLSFHIFSKHLQFLNYKDMADAAANLGFDGIDLTVRKKGHVEPESVVDDLPAAIEAIRNAELSHDMMASDVTNAKAEVHKQVLKTASSLGIQYYRLGYLSFSDNESIPVRIASLNQDMKELADFNKSLNISGAYQNHSGTKVGAQIWDLWHLLQGINPSEIGCQYDIRHAMVEGGQSWENGLKLITPKINCIVLKDFIWKKNKDRKWQLKNVPLGEGMVDFSKYFKLLKAANIHVPVTIHYEYELGGVEHGATKLDGMKAPKIFKRMKKDLLFAKRIWKET